MDALSLLFLTASAALLSGWISRAGERRRAQSKVQELESRIRYAQGETFQLREQLAALKAEADVLKLNLEEERRAGAAALGQLALSFRKTLIAVSSVMVVAGASAGGAVAWWGATVHAEAKQARFLSERELSSRMDALKAELLEKQLEASRARESELQNLYQEARVQRAVSLTKLQILLDSLVPAAKQGHGFRVENTRLQKNLRRGIQEGPEPELGFLPRPARA